MPARPVVPFARLVAVPTLAGALALGLCLLAPDTGAALSLAGIVLGAGVVRRPDEPGADEQRHDGTSVDDEFFSLLEHSPTPFVVSRPDTGEVLYANRQASALAGIVQSPPGGTGAAGYYADPADRARLLARVAAEGTVRGFETRIRLADGRDRWFALSVSPVGFRGGPALAVSFCDVTGHHRAEEALRLSRRYLARVMDGVPVMMACLDKKERLLAMNQAFADWVGRPIPELLGRDLAGSLGPERYGRIGPEIALGLAGGTVRRRMCIPDREGRDRQVHVTLLPRREEGEVADLSLLLCDITTRHRHEEALRQAMARLNLLSTLTRHDIRNQLTALFDRLDLAAEAEDPAELQGHLGRIRAHAGAIWDLVEFAGTYEQGGLEGPAWFPLEASIARAADELGAGRIAVESRAGGVACYADPLFPRVIFNLIENAARHGATRVSLSVAEEDGGRLALLVEDDGAGVATDEKERIFERGYGRNTGLGLYLAREILGITGATIAEEGPPGVGARFVVRFPPGAWRPDRGPQA
ncbi:MAG TPA: PAS domain-containing sensor histidine kinase [Methanoregulaceae archaeon]|nr:PAS domain-containing sensor histidine kinase [Methanoregulaceae archaeon]